MEFISTGEAPKPHARYSHAVRHGRTVYVAGWMGDDPETGKIVAGGIEAQTIRALQNIQVCLEAAGSDLSRVVRRRLYFIDLKEHLRIVDEVWGRFVEEPHPLGSELSRRSRARVEVTSTQGCAIIDSSVDVTSGAELVAASQRNRTTAAEGKSGLGLTHTRILIGHKVQRALVQPVAGHGNGPNAALEPLALPGQPLLECKIYSAATEVPPHGRTRQGSSLFSSDLLQRRDPLQPNTLPRIQESLVSASGRLESLALEGRGMGAVQSTVSFVGTTSITTISTPTSTTTIPTPTSLSTSTISPISQAPAAAPITAVVTVTTGVDAPGPVSTIVPLETPSGSFLVTSLSISGTAPAETSSGSSSVTSSHISATQTTLLTTTSTTSAASSSSSSYIWPSTPPPYASTALPQTTGSPLYLFTYGDSYTSTGFNIILTPPSIRNPLGNPGYPGVTSTGPGEPNWVDIFVTNSPLNTLMYDLAISGSSVAGANIQGQSRELAHFVNTSTTFAANRPLQPAGRKWNAANSAHLIWFGRNDVYWAVLQNQNTTALMHTRIDAVTASYVTAMQTLFNAGARRFLIMGMPPMWREPEWSLPFAPWTGWAPTIQPAVAYWDATLTRKLKAWKKGKPAVQMSFFDMTPAFSQVLDNTAKWGLRNATCDNLDDPEDAGHCAFSDLVHPGPPLARSIAIAVGRQLVSLGWLKAFALSYAT